VTVQPDLSLPGHSDVFVIGDTALVRPGDGEPLPGVATVAKQQGAYVAHLLIDRMKGRTTPPFRYRHFGILATIGRQHAVV
jgi:NADH:ubiquinone reductase (H+-translocating)